MERSKIMTNNGINRMMLNILSSRLNEINDAHHMLLDALSDSLTDKKGSKRKVLAIFLTGSFGRNLATANSDLDLTLITKPSKYDYLTNTKISHQEIIHEDSTNEKLFDILPQVLNLTATDINPKNGLIMPIKTDQIKLTHLDAHIVSIQDYYKQLCQMDPNAFDMYYRGPDWINFKNTPKWIHQDQPANLIAELQAMPLKYKSTLNLSHMLAAMLGISGHLKPKNLKMVDTVKYFTNLAIDIVKFNYPDCKLPQLQLKHKDTPNYYHLFKEKATIVNVKYNAEEFMQAWIDEQERTLQDAQCDLNECINVLKQLQNIVNSDKELSNKQQKAQNIMTNIFLEYMNQ